MCSDFININEGWVQSLIIMNELSFININESVCSLLLIRRGPVGSLILCVVCAHRY